MKNTKIFKALTSIALCTFTAGLFTSCDKLSDISFVKETSASETSAVVTEPDYSVWKDKYEEFLMSIINGNQTVVDYEFEAEECRFDIREINGDDVPELLISEGSYPGSKVSIYAYDGYEVRAIGSAGLNGELYYSENQNRIFDTEEAENQSTFTVYSIKEYVLTEMWQGTELTENGETKYLINNSEVDKEEYLTQYSQYMPTDVSHFGTDASELTAENIMSVIEQGVKPAVTYNSIGEGEESTSEQTTVNPEESGSETEEVTSELTSTEPAVVN